MDGIHEGETDGARLARMGTDAAAWAESMADTACDVADRRDVGCLSFDEALAQLWDGSPGDFLHVWLANAIEAGRAAGYSQGRRDAIEAAADLRESLERRGADRVAMELDRALAWPLPENLAGWRLPEDSAGRRLPAESSGRDEGKRR